MLGLGQLRRREAVKQTIVAVVDVLAGFDHLTIAIRDHGGREQLVQKTEVRLDDLTQTFAESTDFQRMLRSH